MALGEESSGSERRVWVGGHGQSAYLGAVPTLKVRVRERTGMQRRVEGRLCWDWDWDVCG